MPQRQIAAPCGRAIYLFNQRNCGQGTAILDQRPMGHGHFPEIVVSSCNCNGGEQQAQPCLEH
jgi:hypothetical protein